MNRASKLITSMLASSVLVVAGTGLLLLGVFPTLFSSIPLILIGCIGLFITSAATFLSRKKIQDKSQDDYNKQIKNQENYNKAITEFKEKEITKILKIREKEDNKYKLFDHPLKVAALNCNEDKKEKVLNFIIKKSKKDINNHAFEIIKDKKISNDHKLTILKLLSKQKGFDPSACDQDKGTSLFMVASYIPDSKEILQELINSFKIKLEEKVRSEEEGKSEEEIKEILKEKLKEILDQKDTLGFTALFYASQSNQEENINLLISEGATVDLKIGSEEGTALIEAGRANKTKSVEALLDNGADINITDKKNLSVFTAAIKFGANLVVKDLMESEKIDVNSEYKFSGREEEEATTVLNYAIRKGEIATVYELLNPDKEIYIDLDIKSGQYQMTALMNAAKYNQPEIIRELMKKGADPDLQNEYGHTALMIAAYSNADSCMQELINSLKIKLQEEGKSEEEIKEILKEKLDQKDSLDLTALFYASQSDREENINLLISEGATVDLKIGSGEGTALIAAGRLNKPKAVKALLDNGADINIKNKGNLSVFPTAIKYGASLAVKELIDSEKIDVNSEYKFSKEKDAVTALNYAGRKGDIKTVYELLNPDKEIHVDPDIKSGPHEITALMNATVHNQSEIVRALTKKGANPDLQNKYGQTALMIAVNNQDCSCVKELLKAGAGLDIKDEHEKTALNYINMDLDMDMDMSKNSKRQQEILSKLSKEQLEILNMLKEEGRKRIFAEENEESLLNEDEESLQKELSDEENSNQALAPEEENEENLNQALVPEEENKENSEQVLAPEESKIATVSKKNNMVFDLSSMSKEEKDSFYKEAIKNFKQDELLFIFDNIEDFREQVSKFGSPVYYAAKENRTDVIKFLVKKLGKQVLNKSYFKEFNPIFRAISEKDKEVLDILIQSKANINMKDEFSEETPLMKASSDHEVEIMETLLKNKGIKKNEVNIEGNTALILAAQGSPLMKDVEDRVKALECLLEAGVKTNIVNIKGKTALAYAYDLEIKEAVDILSPESDAKKSKKEPVKGKTGLKTKPGNTTSFLSSLTSSRNKERDSNSGLRR